MISVSSALEQILARVRILETEQIFLSDAASRILGEPVCSPTDLPPFDRSSMDGYAVLKDDPSDIFKVLGEVRPGEPCLHKIRSGEAVRIFTGAMIPEAAGRVVMQEDVVVEGENSIRVIRSSGVSHIRYRGEDAHEGEILIPSGRKLGPAEMALLAGVGETHPVVRRMPNLVHLVSGDELVNPDEVPVGAQIRDSNSILIGQLVAASGGRMVLQERVPDGLEPSLEALHKIGEDAYDILLVSGGASVGDYDFGKALLRRLEYEIHFEQINLRPGKPLVFASRGRQLAFILPGNPVSHWVIFELVIRPLVSAMMGVSVKEKTVHAYLEEEFAYRSNPRPTFWPARVWFELDRLMVAPQPWQSSGDLTGIVGSNALIFMPSMAGPQAKGAKVEVRLMPPL